MIFVISGPSGVGKGTLVERIVELAPAIHVGRSCTTRRPRLGGHNGERYHFLVHEDFGIKVANNEFAEWAEVHGHLYGTPKKELEHEVVLLEIDCQGARTIKERYPQAQTIFILPPTYLELEKRLRYREQGRSESEILKRLATAAREIHQVSLFDYWIENHEINQSVQKLWMLLQILHNQGKPERSHFRCSTLLGRVQGSFPSNGMSV